MIKIGLPFKEKVNNAVRLCFELTEDDKKPYIAWFEFNEKYEDFLVTERIDGIVANLLFYCMEHEHDIVSACPISERLFFQLTNFFIPSVAKNIKKYKEFKINAPLDNTVYKSENAVGTGISCGVDSFYSVYKNRNEATKNHNITHLTFFNAGASGELGGEKARTFYFNRLKKIEPCAKDLNLPMLTCDTNINEFLQEIHVETHTIRSVAIPLLVQKLFSVYYYSSGFSVWEFQFNDDPASYDIFVLDCLSTENLKFYSVGTETSRLGKTKYIADTEYAQKYLNVCLVQDKNCSRCRKCKRTIIQLLALGKLDNFSEVFDLDYVYKNINEYTLFMLVRKNIIYYKDALVLLKEKKYKIPFKIKLRAFLIRLKISLTGKTLK